MQTVFEIVTRDGWICPVLSGADPAAALISIWDPRWRQAVVLGDSTTGPRFGRPLAEALEGRVEKVLSLSFPAGERSKTRATKSRLEETMLSRGVDRSACVVAVGGGVVLDLAGFVAATYMRGIAHVNVATTLLAQVDAALGGKTGVNTRHGKNLIGAFHQPRAVLLHAGALKSLPRAEVRAGLSEAIKHAVVADAALFDEIEVWTRGRRARAFPHSLLVRCVRIKAEIVNGDERDLGRRQI